MQKVIAIVGPTASGKSALADQVALKLGSEVISVDAMQVYRGMDIGTAKTPVSERLVPLRMVDVASIGENYSCEKFRNEARRLVDDLLSQGKTPVLCGGTGLYLNAVIDQMDFPAGHQKSEARQKYTAFAEAHGNQATWELLNQRDPASAALIHPNNVRRAIRALEMLDEGKNYAEQSKNINTHTPYYPSLIFGMKRNREELYDRINRRVDQMFDQGLVQEVQGLIDEGLEESLTSLQAIGYKEILSAFKGEISLDEARELIKQRSRNYAKRQLTWFKKDPRIIWLDMDELDLDQACLEVLKRLSA